MKSFLPFLSLVLLASCTTAYKSGQTPDDVYFSPQRPQDEYVRVENKRNTYRYEEQSEDDRYLRMKVRNRRVWSDLDYYYNDPVAYNYYYNRYNNFYNNTPWNYYSSWNYFHNPYSYYNPYSTRVIVVNPKAPVTYNRPRQYNMNVYNDPQGSFNNPKMNNGNSNRVFRNNGSQPNYSSPRRDEGNSLRNIFGSTNNSNSSPSNNAPTRTQSSSNSSSSSSSGSSGSSTNAPVRKF